MARASFLATIAVLMMVCPRAAAAEGQKSSHTGDIGPVALVPLTALAGKSSAASLRAAEAAVSAGIGEVEGATLISPAEVRKRARTAGKTRLLGCAGEDRCLRQLGKLANAHYVLHGEIGGLGDAEVIYLRAIDVRHDQPARSTTLALSKKTSAEEAAAAATRLIAPDRYAGALALAIDVDGAAIYIDGQRLGISPLAAPLTLEVGNHALRVTHPEYRDYVRFVEIRFRNRRKLEVGLQQFPVVASSGVGGSIGSVTLKGKPRQPEVPWYREWYTIAGAGAAVLITSAIVVGVLADGIDSDRERTVK